jgi:hypothetical protein
MLSRDGYECGKRCYSDQHNSTLTASEMLLVLTGRNEHSQMNGKSPVAENYIRLDHVWQITLSARHSASLIRESVYMSRLSHD